MSLPFKTKLCAACKVSSFLSSGAAWFTPLCMRELGRLQANFPGVASTDVSLVEADAAAEQSATAVVGFDPFAQTQSLGDGAASFFGLGSPSQSDQSASSAAGDVRAVWPHFMFVAERPEPARGRAREAEGGGAAAGVAGEEAEGAGGVGRGLVPRKDRLKADFARDVARARRLVG